jgi:modulator of FtsH protease HflC
MNKSIAVFVGLGLLIALVLFSMTYSVSFHEVAIKTRFARADSQSVVSEPGLHFKLPLIADTVTKIDTRLQLRESPMETIQTADGQQVVVRAFMMWRVNKDQALNFYQKYPGGVDEANDKLVDTFRTAITQGLSQFRFDDLIGPTSRLQDAEQAIQNVMLLVAQKSGFEPVSVGISQLQLPPKTAMAVLDRMVATRTKIADIERIRGQAVATAIESRARADADKIRSFAEQLAGEIRAKGVQVAANYVSQMNEEPNLAIFLEWLTALEATLSRHTTVVMPTAFSPFHLVNLETPRDGQGIPQPTSGQFPTPRPSTVTQQDDLGPIPPDQRAPADEAQIERQSSAQRDAKGS